jgi:CRISPR/Cas system-associated exonuclease Cas4 (RecB family)
MMSANSQVFKRFLVTMMVLAVGLSAGSLLITPLPAQAQPAIVVAENEDSLQRSIDASAARWQARGEAHLAERVERASATDAARYTALAEIYGVNQTSSARWQAQGEAYLAERAERAAATGAARYTALAKTYAVSPVSSAAGDDASSARWQVQGEAYLAERAERAAATSAARYRAMAEFYAAAASAERADLRP